MPIRDSDLAPLEYELQRRRRKTIGVSVREDGTIEVRAPLRATRADIARALSAHGEWARSRQATVRAELRRRRARRFDDGGSVPYRGGELRLEVSEAPRPRPPELSEDALRLEVEPGLPSEARSTVVRELVGKWLVERAAEVFHERHLAMSALVGDAAERVSIKEMSSRWGSCGPQRRMSLNWRLILAPPAVLDYVLVHELTHIRHPDHSSRFWAAVAAVCPDWREHRDWLRAHGSRLVL